MTGFEDSEENPLFVESHFLIFMGEEFNGKLNLLCLSINV